MFRINRNKLEAESTRAINVYIVKRVKLISIVIIKRFARFGALVIITCVIDFDLFMFVRWINARTFFFLPKSV